FVLRGGPGAIDLRLPRGVVAHGRLLDPDGRPAAGVRLAVVLLGHTAREMAQGAEPAPALPGWPADVTTAPDGWFRFDGFPPGTVVWLQAQDDRYALSTFPVTAGAAEPAHVTLSEPRLLIGRVLAADTGLPLPGARVSILTGTRPAQSLHFTTLAT